MKKIIISSLMALACCMIPSQADAQAKKPTLMVMPAEVWCFENNYNTTYQAQGKTTTVPDYERAYTENSDLLNVTTKIGELMAERGFPLKDMSATIRNLNRSALEDEMTVSATSGAALDETPLEKIMARAKADIMIELTWKVNKVGPKQSVTYTMRGIDAYTNKQVAAAQGTGQPSFTAEVPILLEEAVLEHMDQFISQLMAHFQDLEQNGREVTVNVKVFGNGSGLSMENEYDGTELVDILDDWMAENTVSHRYSMADAGETHVSFDQVRIPLYRENGTPMDTRHFCRKLTKMLNKAPYNIPTKILTKGLGRIDIILGEK